VVGGIAELDVDGGDPLDVMADIELSAMKARTSSRKSASSFESNNSIATSIRPIRQQDLQFETALDINRQ
jgi:hypothetical protein